MAGSIGVIGGADGPTALFVAAVPDALGLIFPAALLLAALAAFLLIRRRKRKKP